MIWHHDMFLQHDLHDNFIFYAFDVNSEFRFVAELNNSHDMSIFILSS